MKNKVTLDQVLTLADELALTFVNKARKEKGMKPFKKIQEVSGLWWGMRGDAFIKAAKKQLGFGK